MADQPPSSVTSTPRTPRQDLASRLAAKTKKEKKEREKGDEGVSRSALGGRGFVPPAEVIQTFCVLPAQKKTTSAGLDPEGLNVEVGDQVLVAGQKHGTVRFFGKTDFAPGGCVRPPPRWRRGSCDTPTPASGYWFGVELDQPTGKHDGSVFGVRYFSCLPKYGVFAPPSRVQRWVLANRLR